MKNISLIITIIFVFSGSSNATLKYNIPDELSNYFHEIKEPLSDYILAPYLFSYTVLTPEGYYNDKGVFEKYNSPLPPELKEIEFSSLKSTKLADTTYLLYPGGGILFTFKEGSIKRIDSSFAHRNYYHCHFFTHQNEIYVLGGYGLWTSKNDLIKYSFIQKQWEKIETFGDKPETGLRGLSVIKTENMIYTIGGNFIENNTQQQKEINKIYSLNLSNYEWKHNFSLSDKDVDYVNSRRNHGVQIDNQWVIFPTVNNDEFLYIDPINGLIKSRKTDEIFESNKTPLFLNGFFISTKSDKISSRKNILYSYAYKNEGYDNENSLKNIAGLKYEHVFLLSILTLTILFLIWLLLVKTKSYKLSNNSISKGKIIVELEASELYFLSRLAKYGFIMNSELVHLFNEDGKTQDLFVKRKNSMVKNLEEKLKMNFNRTFFFKSVDPSDKRQSVYQIAPKIVFKQHI